MKKIKIAVVGIGGVGGFFGGLLAKKYANDSKVQVNFLSRGNNLTKIQGNGLKVIAGNTVLIARPYLATDEPAEIGIVDYVIICTKSYDLEETIRQLKPCIADQTVILPLLNGVANKDLIKKILPNNLVLDGCVYIISRLNEAGVVENKGNIQKLFFGLDSHSDEKLELLESICKEADIEVTLSKEISKIIWEKYIFISAMATATSYFDSPIGRVISENETALKGLISEISALAKAKKIKIVENIEGKTLAKLKSLPFGATSSMHSEIQSGKRQFELGALTGYVVDEGHKMDIQTPTYAIMYDALKKLL